ncbi:xanthine dehydrogenase family protein subunit M [Acidianus sulfidivorans JP7]|uniref:Carbon monoxide dehydrogenase n=1 Tax=Acidianus sulfidivorans JP7 TaxID=619593 RepID=A0A2U9IPX5_9CREN|nr:glyceraldehyde dehydrogenase subunit beta [Acidianus sulfidivorans]AWR98036.1 xanthine dehydrogenase family protein subunit M [Acidianus sulfidivorans JP7]
MFPPKFGYYKPSSLADALDFLSGGGVRPLAGGQSLIPMLKLRVLQPNFLLDLNPLKDLEYIRDEGKVVSVGALTRHVEIEKNTILKTKVPLLQETAHKVGDMQVRNLGTIGGSLSNADPSADYPAIVLAYDATITLLSSAGERKVSAKDFFKGPFTTQIAENEILSNVQFPVLEGYKFKYQKIVRRAGDFALVGMAVLSKVEGDEIVDLRVSYTGVSDTPYRPYELEKTLINKKVTDNNIDELLKQFADKVSNSVNPPSDSRGSSSYRRKVMSLLTYNTLKEVLKS